MNEEVCFYPLLSLLIKQYVFFLCTFFMKLYRSQVVMYIRKTVLRILVYQYGDHCMVVVSFGVEISYNNLYVYIYPIQGGSSLVGRGI